MKRAKLETDCWVWPYAVNSDGYGSMQKDKVYYEAHRFLYLTLVGPIPYKSHLDHLCRNHRCVNPTHLEPVSQAENSRRGKNAKLDVIKVAEIRRLSGKKSHKEIAEMFGVCRQSITMIIAGKRWL